MHCFGFSFADFEQVNAGWIIVNFEHTLHLFLLFLLLTLNR